MRAIYRKLNDHSHNSSKYHKKDGTTVRAKLKEQARKIVLHRKSADNQILG